MILHILDFNIKVTVSSIDDNNVSVKIIAISGGGGNKTMDFLDLAKKIGADAVIAKPIDMDMLEKTVKKLAG